MRGRIVGILTWATGIALATLFVGGTLAEPSPPGDPPALTTGTASSSPAPVASLVTPASIELTRSLEALMSDSSLQRCSYGVHALNVRTGAEVFAANATQPLRPASTMKVITTATALHTLGPSYRFRTEVYYDGTFEGDGILSGNLYVKGYGDPTMVLEKLWKLVYDIRLEGLQEVRGNIVFDDTFFDAERAIPGWEKRLDIANGPAYFAPLGALSLNFNTTTLVIGPGEKPGAQARVEQEITTGLVELNNRMRTGGKGSRRWLRMDRKVDNLKMKLDIAGSVPYDSDTIRYYRAVADPTAYFTGAVATLAKTHGIRVKGRWINGTVPAGAKMLVRSDSQELLTILMDVNKHSNNFMTEQILKTVGAENQGVPGSSAKGLESVSKYLSGLGIPATEYNLLNGSGLSRQTFVQARHLTAVLRDMYLSPLVGAEFRSSLSIGGKDGTLKYRFRDEDELGRIRGKTGTLDGVHCLAGYVEARDGEVYAFAFLANDIRGPLSRLRAVQTRFAETLFSGPVAPATPPAATGVQPG